jgi:hypothetical protein
VSILQCLQSRMKHDVHGDAQLRLKPTGQALCLRHEEIRVPLDRACNREQRATLIGQHRKAGACIYPPDTSEARRNPGG